MNARAGLLPHTDQFLFQPSHLQLRSLKLVLQSRFGLLQLCLALVGLTQLLARSVELLFELSSSTLGLLLLLQQLRGVGLLLSFTDWRLQHLLWLGLQQQ